LSWPDNNRTGYDERRHVLDVRIASSKSLAPAPEIPLALDEMIYSVTSGALADAGRGIGDVHGSVMAASDLYDGRAISTMTLTGSTGSFHKSEMRVCNDSLAALMLASAEIESGDAEALIVGTWSKLSDAPRDTIVPLAMEPVFARGLGYHPDTVVALRESRDTGRVAVVTQSQVAPVDVATAMVLCRPGSATAPLGRIRSFGASTGPYLIPQRPLLEPLAQSASRALRAAGISIEDLTTVWVAGMSGIAVTEVAAALGAAPERVRRDTDASADLGYAAGLTALHAALGGEPGLMMVVSGGGAGLENTFATVVDVA
jgi:acetyl-CoA acetyltransferase